MKVNLTRIHNMLKQLDAELRAKRLQAAKPLSGDAEPIYMDIFEGTTDADIDEFLTKVHKRKAQIENILDLTRQLVAYHGYLRHELDKANRKSGVADKLLQVANIQKEMENLTRIISIMSMSCSDNYMPIKNADYYKTSFTDTQKTYTLSVKVFSNADINIVEKEFERQEKTVNTIKDEIAMINQTTTITIMDFEEFKTAQK